MYLDEIVKAQKAGEVRGITSVCSAHPEVLRQTLYSAQRYGVPAVIEATCNQVNQFGGYTGMRPPDFVAFLRELAAEVGFPWERVILGGDHLGPSPWQSEPAETAMAKAEYLVRQYAAAGFMKIHLDCSMRLGDDPDPLPVEVVAQRTVRLASVVEEARTSEVRYVIGSEVPVPGGAISHEGALAVTPVAELERTLQLHQAAFAQAGLVSAWQKVFAVVVQPGVEFGDTVVWDYQTDATRELAAFIALWPLVYEAHSTDYQSRAALSQLVRDHFAILKVGPMLTFAFREAVFALAALEDQLLPAVQCSQIVARLDEAMLARPGYWQNHYHGSPEELAAKRHLSYSDRIRYYWKEPAVDAAYRRLMENMGERPLRADRLANLLPSHRVEHETELTGWEMIARHIQRVLDDYAAACGLIPTRD